MNKVFSVILLTLMIISVIGMTSAVSAVGTTFIAGKIYNSDYSDIISGADVSINCGGNISTTTSLSDGSYSATYSTSECNVGSDLTVSGSKGSLYGSKSGVIHKINDQFDFSIVNVPLVPEFGLGIGALTIFSALGIFFLVRKK